MFGSQQRQARAGTRSWRCIGSATEAFGEGVGLICELELERHEHPVIRIAARKARQLETPLIKPYPHRAHLLCEIAWPETKFYGAHCSGPVVGPSRKLIIARPRRRWAS